MRIHVEPAIERWQPAQRQGRDRQKLTALAAEHARRLDVAAPQGQPGIIMTGHQPWLWHPGILAKDIAAAAAAERFDAQAIHLVVDQDVLDQIDIELPIQRGHALAARRVVLAPCLPMVPIGVQPPADAEAIVQRLEAAAAPRDGRVLADLKPLIEAFGNVPPCQTLAEQMGVVLARLRRPVVPSMPIVFATELAKLDGFDHFMRRMRDDPARCVSCYNEAAAQHPDAGIKPLRTEGRRIELPLWALRWQGPRRRVFADVSNGTAVLTLENGQPAGGEHSTLAPRALLMTALLRSEGCGLFIHGKGGALYDRVTEQWVRNWLTIELAPIAIVSADLFLPLDVPLAEPRDVAAAAWWVHHLPHNLDRALRLDGPRVRRKRILLEQMDDDRDRQRRGRAFQEIHTINHELAQQHAEELGDAQRTLSVTVAGAANRAIAQKRDWSFALHAAGQLRDITKRLSSPL